ncbi:MULTISPECIES: hypothetical protein [unclassified Shinella]|uniref:hypothetical protein n=1 Tax=unclassified Shinella TaxID=2643062 RepID=UPI00234E6699|nr:MULTISPECIES: hypothetical protein [unclassified Shinella]MCO5153920.1 hypothetical protein [Shinella sp.]MDC7262857.1 hypothetical protein [Shinella sp. HY16]MDC7269752.1 hypothetical protein [Shinella sp. YZ44]
MTRLTPDRDLKLEQVKGGGNMKNSLRKSKSARSGKEKQSTNGTSVPGKQTEGKRSAEILDLLASGRALSILKDLRNAEKEDDGKYHAAVHKRILKSYQIALLAAESLDLWQEICGSEEWASFKRRPKHDDQQDALRYVVRLYVGFDGVSDDKRASKYYRSLKSWFDRKTPVSDVRKILKGEGGIEALAKFQHDPPVRKIKEGYVAITLIVPEAKGRKFLSFKSNQRFNWRATVAHIEGSEIEVKDMVELIPLMDQMRSR